MSAATVLVLFAVGASSAAAASPWWQLDAGTRPTNLKPGVAQNEVQKLTVVATGGEVAIAEPISVEKEEPEFIKFKFDATHEEVQTALEQIYGAGNIEVIGGSLEPENTRNYSVTFKGTLAFQPQRLMSTAFSAFFLEGEATASELAEGRADGELFVTAENLGDGPVDGSKAPVKLTDTLPPGLEAVAIGATRPQKEGNILAREPIPCDLATLTCTYEESLPTYDALEMRIFVKLTEGAHTGELNRAKVTGGTAAPAQISRPLVVSDTPTPFGVEDYRLRIERYGGSPATAAASHPYQATGVVAVNQGPASFPLTFSAANPVTLAKDVITKLPPGFIGDPTPFPTCSLGDFLTQKGGTDLCPDSAAIGVASVNVDANLKEPVIFRVPLFNLEAAPGEPARFGFYLPVANVPVVLDTALRSGRGETLTAGSTEPDYGIDVETTNISQTGALSSARVSFWGTPGDPRHDASRGWECLAASHNQGGAVCVPPPAQPHPPAFLTMPTACSGSPLLTSVEADSWAEAGVFGQFFPPEPLQSLDSCNQVPFKPEIHSEPTSSSATSPTGLSFDINFSDEGLLNSESLAQSQIKRAVVTLPQGFTANPSVAEGLKACSEAEYEAATLESSGCSEESKVGEVEIDSPLVAGRVEHTVKGGLYVAKQHDNPNGNLLTLYMVARAPELGVLIKQALKVEPDPVTGQLRTEVDNVPQLPFSRFHLFFRSGQRAPLITPPACGNYTVQADLYPWSNPTVPLHRESSFQITGGPEGQGCPSGGVPPFHPDLHAGTYSPRAGAYSPFYTRITRKDSEQEITHFSIKLPPGVIGKLAGVSSCSDAAIAAAKAREKEGGGQEELNSPSCPANSEIGHTNVGSGVGNVLAYAPGKLYLAGPYHGSNLSIVSITAAKVGPFDLGTVVVRFALKIDPETAEVSVDGATSDPIPHIVDGIPIHLRDIQAFVDRPDFTLNPTSCKPTSTASTLLGSGLNFASEADDQPVTVTSFFQVANCASLGFAPKLALSLKGGTKRGSTPAFKAVLTYPKGSYANIAKSVVTLPHSEFLEQGHIGTVCTRVQFKEGSVPGEKCPAASIYGRAEARTPLLSEPLKGPVYLRSSSHNLPDLVAALHNQQVDFALDGRIDSIKNGRIRNTFETVPDAPVSKFVLEMQGGKKGLLVNSTNLCARKNRAISEFTGQNGKLYNTNPVLQAKCGKKGKKAHKHQGAHK